MSEEILGCKIDGDCDRCMESDCIATIPQILRFYSREEEESRRKWGLKRQDEDDFMRD